jgi:folate-binding protein YgfZ
MNTAPLQIDPAEKSSTQLDALLHSAATFALSSTWVMARGEDRQRWLNGMVTNSIQALTPGTGCYNFLLSAQGRIEGDCNVFNAGDFLLLQTGAAQRDHLIQWLDHYIIMDDVELVPMDACAGIGIAGPAAKAALEALFPGIALPAIAIQEALNITPPFDWQGHQLTLIAAHSTLVPKYEIWATPDALPALQLSFANLPAAGDEAVESLRLLEGTPRYGTDIRNTTDRHELPQETAPAGVTSRALHFSKGCYLGQEIVERIRSRGNLHRTFSGFLVTGDIPPPGTAILADEKEVGEITSAARIPLAAGTITLALGYIRREAVERKLPLTANGTALTPTPLPVKNL